MKKIIVLIALTLVPSIASAKTGSLDKAYQREVAYLQAQKRSLEQRNVQVKKEGGQKIAALKGNVNSLQTRWLTLQAESEALQERLNELNINSPTTDEQKDALVGTYEQARQSLINVGHDVVERDVVSSDDLRTLFGIGVTAIVSGRDVKTETGTYFDESGHSKTGKITYVGRIAAYADGRPLAPAGEQRMKLWPSEKNGPNVVLFESVEKTLAVPKEETVSEMLEAGGTIAYIIVVLGFFALLLALARIFLLGRFASGASFGEELSKLNTTERAKALAEKARGLAPTGVSKLLARENPEINDVDEIVTGLAPKVERFSTLLLVIAAIAPLLGLLGTVTGMIATFDIITEFGTGDPKLLSGGISEALITTKLGLMVAIPALILGNVLRAWGERIVDDLEHSLLIALGMSTGRKPVETNDRLELAKAVVITQGGRLGRAVS